MPSNPDASRPDPVAPVRTAEPMGGGTLVVAVIDDSPVRASIVQEGLRGAGVGRVAVLGGARDLVARLAALNPDVIVIDAESPGRDLLEQMAHGRAPRAFATFVDEADTPLMEAAIDSGVSAYAADGLEPARVRAVIDVAIRGFAAAARLRREMEARPEDEAAVARATALVASARGLAQAEARDVLRRAAEAEGRTLADLARAVVTAAELLA